MTKKNLFLKSTPSRILFYVSLFIVGGVLVEIFKELVHPIMWSTAATIFIIVSITLFGLAGFLVAKKGGFLAHVSAISVSVILAIIALRFGYTVAAPQYLNVLAILIAYFGSHPLLYRHIDMRRQAGISCIVVVVSILIIILFSYTMVILDRIAL